MSVREGVEERVGLSIEELLLVLSVLVAIFALLETSSVAVQRVDGPDAALVAAAYGVSEA